MPFFDYCCKKCGKVEESYDPPEMLTVAPRPCTYCDGVMFRVVPAPVVIFKGDFETNSHKKADKDDK